MERPIEAATAIRRIPDPEEPVPAVAWPTLALLVGALAGWTAATVLYLDGQVAWWVAVPVNTILAYALFSVCHEAGHHAASGHGSLNFWMGRIATPFFAPIASFETFRYIHMQHHRFTNHDDGRDPDHYTMSGPGWQRLFRWATIDVRYLVFYLPRLRDRPRGEQRAQAVTMVGLLVLLVAAIATGHLVDLLVVYIIPSRLAVMLLAWAFDYLPHAGLHATPEEDRLKTTRNRVGWERVMAPLMLYQNYHLVHHLHPVVPFYRYLRVWRRNEAAYLDGDPPLRTVAGRELTAEEYRELRRLAEHHG